eukprot:COSAG01_NODE_326_length_18790_cov_10.366005_15_plen_117_part_00
MTLSPQTLIKKFPTLRLLDGKDVTMEERERTEVRGRRLRLREGGPLSRCNALFRLAQLLFSTEPRASPTFATDSKYVLSTKVPVRLTSMNFETLTSRQQAEAAHQAGLVIGACARA